MEIESEDGSRISLKPGVETVFGRGKGFKAEDFTVSRRHLLLEVEAEQPRVSFEVVGINPVWVRREATGKVEVFRRLEKGKAEIGDSFCVSGQRPIWFTFKKCVPEEEISDVDCGLDSVDISNVDPVKEFGYLVIGKEFEQYPKNRVHEVKQWDWFLDEPKKQDSESDDDDDQNTTKGKKRTVKKRSRSRSKGEDDEDWTGDSEEDKDVIAKSRKSQRPKYSTRSKDPKKRRGNAKNGVRKDDLDEDDSEDEVDEDEDDETLGGFIVGDDGAEQDEGNELGEEEEEEDFEDDEDED